MRERGKRYKTESYSKGEVEKTGNDKRVKGRDGVKVKH